MEQRTLLAIGISIAILLAYSYFAERFVPPVKTEQGTKEPVKEEHRQSQGTPTAVVPPVPKTDVSEVERNIVVENNFYKALFSSKGGTIKSIELKNYKDYNGKPIILKGDDALPPLSLGVDEGFQFSHVNFSVSGADIRLTPAMTKASLVFQYSSHSYSISRTYTFSYDQYGFQLKDEVKGLATYLITLGKDFGIYEKNSSVHFGPVILKDADREEFTGKKLKETRHFKEGVKWIALEDKYFFSSIVPKVPIEDAMVWNESGDALVALKMDGGVNDYVIYAGPKEYDVLKKFGAGLEHIIDFGRFSFLAVPLFWVLKFFYSIVHNYGVAIIILTTLVRIPFIPIVNKGQKSMKKLQDIQPRMAEIREKYKKDPQKMQQELMALYKKHKVNPMGGCLPMVLQIPVFFALYKILLISIELRGAPFALWIHDLSMKDPYYILPIVMGVTMVIQQKMTPSSMDPKQQKIMMLMPIVFTFMFLSFPSGLVLYWLANNMLSIIQQFYVNKKAENQPA